MSVPVMNDGNAEAQFNKELFGDDFKWGVSVAAPQIEGSYNADGRGRSVWDVFADTKGKILNGDHPKTACDFYNRYESDIKLIKELGIPNFRFSIAWPRILPSGAGAINQAGIDFYNKVIDCCLANGVEPWVTLYHWDLPHQLEQKGGWTNRDIVSWFSNYVTICAQSFGDRVKHWMVMNEPAVFVGAGYFMGLHAPGRTGLKSFLPAVHHTVLAMAAGGRVLRQCVKGAKIGTTFSCSHIEPNTPARRDVEAAKRADTFINRLFIEATLGMGYPLNEVKVFKGITKFIMPGDDALMKFDFDFIGLQNYTREIVKYSFLTPYIGAALVKAENRKVPLTEMKWEIYPQAIYEVIKKFNAYPGIKQIIITENGAAFKDKLVDGQVDDPQRTQYIKDNLAQVLKAKSEGCRVEGYFVWTLIDNFEWAEGYHPRFGLIYVNYETQQRTIKNSGYWYQGFLK
jgi:beta-glucosidase